MSRLKKEPLLYEKMPDRPIIAGKRHHKLSLFFYEKREAETWATKMRKKDKVVRIVKAKTKDIWDNGVTEINDGYILYYRDNYLKKVFKKVFKN